MAGANTNIFSQTKTLNDFTQEDAIRAFQQQVMAAKLQQAAQGAQLPAPLQLANEYQKRLQIGDVEGANLIMQFAKTQDKGLQVNSNGQFSQLPGYAGSVAGIEGAKAGAKEQAQSNVEVVMQPKIKQGTAFAEAMGKGSGEANSAMNVKGINAPATLSVLDQIEAPDATGTSLLDRANGSTLGAMGSSANKFVGRSTPATQANAELAVLGNTLVSNIPRMQGPQSDKDVEFYKSQAGKLGDPSVPADDKRAAIASIRKLQEKYAKNNVNDLNDLLGGAVQTTGGWTVRKIK